MADADFGDRLEAAARGSELRAGRLAVRGGWPLYSSGPGRTVRRCLLGVRESFGDIVFDPEVPRSPEGPRRLGERGGQAFSMRFG